MLTRSGWGRNRWCPKDSKSVHFGMHDTRKIFFIAETAHFRGERGRVMMLFPYRDKKFLLEPHFEDVCCYLGVIREGIRAILPSPTLPSGTVHVGLCTLLSQAV